MSEQNARTIPGLTAQETEDYTAQYSRFWGVPMDELYRLRAHLRAAYELETREKEAREGTAHLTQPAIRDKVEA